MRCSDLEALNILAFEDSVALDSAYAWYSGGTAFKFDSETGHDDWGFCGLPQFLHAGLYFKLGHEEVDSEMLTASFIEPQIINNLWHNIDSLQAQPFWLYWRFTQKRHCHDAKNQLPRHLGFWRRWTG